MCISVSAFVKFTDRIKIKTKQLKYFVPFTKARWSWPARSVALQCTVWVRGSLSIVSLVQQKCKSCSHVSADLSCRDKTTYRQKTHWKQTLPQVLNAGSCSTFNSLRTMFSAFKRDEVIPLKRNNKLKKKKKNVQSKFGSLKKLWIEGTMVMTKISTLFLTFESRLVCH